MKLLDFGISKFNLLSADSGFSMTRAGAVMGTPYYMAPEQAKGAKDADHRVDLYAAGVILYESVTGQVPFNADTFNELLFKIVLEEPRPVQQLAPHIDPGFAAIISKAMARDPAVRFQTAKEFQLALEYWANNAGPELANALRAPAAGRGSLADGTGAFGRIPKTGAGQQLGTGTAGTWANTGGVTAQLHPPLKQSNTGLYVVLGVVGLLVIGGGALGLRVLNQAAAPAPVAAAVPPNAADEKAKTDALLAEAKAKADADAKAEAEQKADAEQKAAAAAPSAAPPVIAAAKPRAAARPVAVKAAPKPAAAPAPSPASTGRKIRTSL